MTSQLSETALIIIDHGSRRDDANRLIEEVADRLRAEGRFAPVVTAHMEVASPTLQDAFGVCAARGARRVVIVPYFLASGNHATHDIPRMAEEAARDHPEIAWALAEPLGLDKRLIALVTDRAQTALDRLKRPES